MRLNLPRHNCVSFSVFSEFTAPKEKDAEIQAFMERTITRSDEDDDGEVLAAFYGWISRAGGVAHMVSGALTKQSSNEGGGDDMSLTLVSERSEGITPPPREMRSVNDLIEAASDLFGHIEVSCSALFEYERERGFASRIHFPAPMIVQDDGGITHMESALFSRRDADGIQYSIAVGNTDDGSGIAHSVDFKTIVSLDQDQTRALFNNAASISSRLVTTG